MFKRSVQKERFSCESWAEERESRGGTKGKNNILVKVLAEFEKWGGEFWIHCRRREEAREVLCLSGIILITDYRLFVFFFFFPIVCPS